MAVWKAASKGSLGSGRLDQMVWGLFGCLLQCNTRNLGAKGAALAAGSFTAEARVSLRDGSMTQSSSITAGVLRYTMRFCSTSACALPVLW